MSEPRFALFRGDVYYPCGGFEDYEDTFATLAEAKAADRPTPYSWAHVVDLETCEILEHREEDHPWETT